MWAFLIISTYVVFLKIGMLPKFNLKIMKLETLMRVFYFLYKIVMSGKGHSSCKGAISYVLDDAKEMPYCQNLGKPMPGLFCGYATCYGSIQATWTP